MRILAIAGPPGTGRTALIETLLDRLEGRVATVEQPDHDPAAAADRHRHPGAASTHALADDGAWFGAGEGRTLDGLLADLAPDHDYALLEGFAGADVPTVALGGVDHAGDTVLAAPGGEAVDVDALVAALDEREPFETLGSLVAEAKRSPDAEYSGAIATFTGRVRRKEGPDDPPTEYLEFEKYEGVAAEKLETIKTELEARDGVYEVLLHHRTGVVEGGEDIVFVVVLAGHREEAFETVEDGIDRLKDEVPLFKKEVTVDDTFWSHERPE
jgi:molybdopterin synthase catalytic subunit